MTTSGLRREGRQFRQLLRLSYNRLLDAALASREIDAVQFVIWGAALMSTFPFFYAVQVTSAYAFTASRLPLAVFHHHVLQDRLFFITWAMVTAMLLVSMMWDALFPDRTDQQILGVLPVRARTVAAARFTAAVISIVAFVAATTVLGAGLYTATGGQFPGVGSRPGILVGHLTSAVTAGLFTTFSLLLMRGMLVFVTGGVAAAKASIALQAITVILLVETFMFLPGILPGIVSRLLTDPAGSAGWWPPAWFLGIYVGFAGPASADAVAALSSKALAGTAAAGVLAVISYLAPSQRNARREIEALPGGRRSSCGSALIVSALNAWSPAPATRATFAFILQSLFRNKQHMQSLAMYAGAGAAVAGIRLIAREATGLGVAFDRPVDFIVAIPLAMTFFLVLGLRSAFAVPTDPQATWVFRLVSARSLLPCIRGTRAAMVVIAVVPPALAILCFGLWEWNAVDAAAIAIMQAASGIVLVEISLVGWRSIPFTRQYVGSTTAVKVGWYTAIVALHIYAFRLDDIQLAVLASPFGGSVVYVAVAALVVALIRRIARWWFREVSLVFDAPVNTAISLNISRV
ncbi:MAG: hypothetical protein Q8O42_17395 [Acidobacteriota bacterium]|nr:hypothetical protein [Acidobacteriota bacterium]